MKQLYTVKCDYGMHYHAGTAEEINEEVETCRKEANEVFGLLEREEEDQ